ncbi:MAG: hypothetical protein NTZ75_08780 [Euryarchaeota archaeon]|nr:hypothetical protein [Euryarchaeota archaeon]
MDKNPLIGVSIVAVVLLILGSLTNVVGYQAVQSSNQKVISNEVDQKELLFQTILDLANNREIQKIIMNSEMRKGGFFNPDTRISVFTPHVLTKTELNTAYHIGLILSKNFDVSRIHSMVKQYQLNNQWMQKEITAVIEKDAKLNGEMTQLLNSKCDCGNSLGITAWQFPVMCTIANILMFIALLLIWWPGWGYNLFVIAATIIEIFNCWP